MNNTCAQSANPNDQRESSDSRLSEVSGISSSSSGSDFEAPEERKQTRKRDQKAAGKRKPNTEAKSPGGGSVSDLF